MRHLRSKKGEEKAALEDLRTRAERRIKEGTEEARLDSLSHEDIRGVIHELATHQIELEMQNEELRHAQEELNASRLKYADLYDYAPTGYVTFDKDGVIVEANTTAAVMLDLNRRSLIRKHFLGFVEGAKDKEVFAGHCVAVLNKQMKSSCELRLKGKIGRLFYARLESTPFKSIEDDSVLIRTIIIDITERKNVEDALWKAHDELEQRVSERTKELSEANVRLREIDRLKSMFIASMSHELRTPLNAVIGFARVLFNGWAGPVNDEQKENLAAILNSGKHLLALVNNVIDLCKAEAGIIETFGEEFDIDDAISDAVKTVSQEAAEKGLEVEVEPVHQKVHVDRGRFFQCILNIMSNAVKFTQKGTITVGAALRGCPPDVGTGLALVQTDAGAGQSLHETPPQDNKCIEISIEDTGIGIMREDIPKLFSPFVRLDSPLKAVTPGTGIGLYLTKKLVTEVLKGDIMVASEYGKGSKFTIRMPVRVRSE